MADRPEMRESTAGQEGKANFGEETPRVMRENIEKLAETARAGAAFGSPLTVGEQTIIPVADVMCGIGFGLGSGEGPEGSGSGGGGGGGSRSRPVAAIVVDSTGVEVRPVVDVTTIWLSALATVGFGILWALRLTRMARSAGKVLR